MYNLLGSVAPMFVSVITVPRYLHLIGPDRYGVLALGWLFLGYFGLFDPGITRAAVFHIARLHSPEQQREREDVFWTALAVNVSFGVLPVSLCIWSRGRYSAIDLPRRTEPGEFRYSTCVVRFGPC